MLRTTIRILKKLPRVFLYRFVFLISLFFWGGFPEIVGCIEMVIYFCALYVIIYNIESVKHFILLVATPKKAPKVIYLTAAKDHCVIVYNSRMCVQHPQLLPQY